ncbi:hypothetical protein GKD10_16900 [Paeniclostridium sordellii]|nr:hypothetical protein [Paeniclostridium sordellii]
MLKPSNNQHVFHDTGHIAAQPHLRKTRIQQEAPASDEMDQDISPIIELFF